MACVKVRGASWYYHAKRGSERAPPRDTLPPLIHFYLLLRAGCLGIQTVWLLEFRPFDSKVSAINSNSVSDELADMIRKRIEPGQKLAVEN